VKQQLIEHPEKTKYRERDYRAGEKRNGGHKSRSETRTMKLETRVFDLYNGRYMNLPEVAQAMGMTPSQIYRVRQGKCSISEKFIIGALKAFHGYTLNDLFYVVPYESKSEGTTNEAGVAAGSRRDEVVKLKNAGLSYAEIGRRLCMSGERARQILMGNRNRPKKPDLNSRAMLTTGDVAQLLGLHVNTVRRWRSEGKLKSYRVSPRGDSRFRREDIECFLEKEEVATT
jgi:excisionase family DNA binding protein